MEYFGIDPTGCQMNAAGRPWRQTWGRNIRPRSVSLARSGLVKSGSASLATKTKIRTTAAIPVRATSVMPNSTAPSWICRRRMAGSGLPVPGRELVLAVTGMVLSAGGGMPVAAV